VVEGERSTPVERFDVRCDAVAHRVVFGGSTLSTSAVWPIDWFVQEELERATPRAPLHNEPMLAALEKARAAHRDVPHVAVMDSFFHRTMPPKAAQYALPRRLTEAHEITRYGFHGLSVAWAAEQVPVARLVVCHLGGGCSVTAVLDGRSVDTTMGFTPLEGLPMATRSGSVDPGALLYLLREGWETVESLDRILEHGSGLLGLSGISGDLRELEASPSKQAKLALELFDYRIAQAVASMAVALGGLDVLAFTGGIGEHSERTRTAVCSQLELFEPFRVEVVEAREDVVAARETIAVLQRNS
jgi:acetate kinase